MEIILATDAHVPEIVEVWKEFMDYHKNIDVFFTRTDNGHVQFEKFIKDMIHSETAHVLVALDQDRVVGYSIAKIAEYPPVFQLKTYGAIFDMAVRSSHRRKGIGAQILAKILEWFDSRGIRRIELTVAARNQIGYSFWKKHGFRDYKHVLYLNK